MRVYCVICFWPLVTETWKVGWYPGRGDESGPQVERKENKREDSTAEANSFLIDRIDELHRAVELMKLLEVEFVKHKNLGLLKNLAQEIPRYNKLRTFNRNLKSPLIYACESWKVAKSLTKKIQIVFVNSNIHYIQHWNVATSQLRDSGKNYQTLKTEMAKGVSGVGSPRRDLDKELTQLGTTMWRLG